MVDQFMFSVVLREIAECDAAPWIDFIAAEVPPFDLSTCTVFVRKVLNQTNRNLVLDPLAITLSSGAKKQYPGFTLCTAFLF